MPSRFALISVLPACATGREAHDPVPQPILNSPDSCTFCLWHTNCLSADVMAKHWNVKICDLRNGSCAVAAAVGLALVGCGHNSADTAVEVREAPSAELNLTTDLEIPQAIDSLRIELVDTVFDVTTLTYRTTWSTNYELGPGGLALPARVPLPALYPYDDPRVHYRVKAWKGANAELFAESIITLPSEGVLVIEQPLAQSCYGWVTTDSNGVVGSNCPAEEACSAGACVAIDRTGAPLGTDASTPDAG